MRHACLLKLVTRALQTMHKRSEKCDLKDGIEKNKGKGCSQQLKSCSVSERGQAKNQQEDHKDAGESSEQHSAERVWYISSPKLGAWWCKKLSYWCSMLMEKSDSAMKSFILWVRGRIWWLQVTSVQNHCCGRSRSCDKASPTDGSWNMTEKLVLSPDACTRLSGRTFFFGMRQSWISIAQKSHSSEKLYWLINAVKAAQRKIPVKHFPTPRSIHHPEADVGAEETETLRWWLNVDAHCCECEAARPHRETPAKVWRESLHNHQSTGGSDVIKCLCVFSYLANKKGSSSIFQFLVIIYSLKKEKKLNFSNCYCKIV